MHEETKKEEYVTPIFKTFFDGVNSVFWCPFCKKFHFHGIGEGHRSSHCIWHSPIKNGYKIKYYNKKELRKIKEMIDYMLDPEAIEPHFNIKETDQTVRTNTEIQNGNRQES